MKRTKLNDVLAALMLIIYFAELVFPIITTIFPSSIVCFFCFFAWMLLAASTDTKFFLRKGNFILLAIYLFLAITPIIFGYSVISHRYANMGLVICGSIIFNYYYFFDKLYILKKILAVTAVLSLITMVVTYGQLLINPYISRSIKSNGEYSAGLASRGIGGYAFIYYIAALSIAVLYYAIKCRTTGKKIVAIVWFIFSVVFVIKSNYMTAFLTIVLCSAALVMLSAATHKKWRFARGLLAGLILIMIGVNFDKIIQLIADFLPSRISSVLVSEGSDSIVDSVWQEFMLDRWPTIQTSINTFLDHPVFGLIGSGNLGFDGQFLTGFGQHSYIFDTYALFGVLGGTINAYAVFRPLKKDTVLSDHPTLRIALIISMVMLYFLNNATESIALVLTIIAPYIACCVKDSNDCEVLYE